MTTNPAVTLAGLSKRYRQRMAVDRLTLDIPAGVVAGFIGPNGAGKTTTLAMLLGLVAPSSGTGTVLGVPLTEPAGYLGRVGALVEGPALWPGLTGAQNLQVLGTLAGHDLARIPDVLERVGLAERANDRFGSYSFGMKQRLGIAGALLGDPELLILDEPTNGLDPVGINEMRRLIGTMADGNRTVLVSSHLLSELEQVCDWLVVIDQGSLLYQGPPGAFRSGGTSVAVAPEDTTHLDALATTLRSVGHEVNREDDALLVSTDGVEPRVMAAALNRAAFAQGIVLAEVAVRRPSLESHYLSTVTGGDR